MSDILDRIDAILEQRKTDHASASYVASLYEKGTNAILKKIGEEATETVIAVKEGDPSNIIYETADLWFHTMVMLKHQGLDSNAVLQELERRFGTSGIEEKASRKGIKSD